MNVIILHNQSLLDISLQLTGSVLNFLSIAKENNIIPTDEVMAGTELNIPSKMITNKEVLNYYKTNGIKPATALTKEAIKQIEGCKGIACWAIGMNFKVG